MWHAQIQYIMLPLNPILIAFCLGVMISFALPYSGTLTLRLGLLFIGIMVFLCAKITKRFIIGASVLLGLILGANYAIWYTNNQLKSQFPLSPTPQNLTLTVRVDELPQHEPDGAYARFIGTATTKEGQSYRLLFHDYQGSQWQLGDEWQIKARVRTPIGLRNPVGFDREAWALANKIDGIANVGKERQRLLTDDSLWSFNAWRARMIASWHDVSEKYPHGVGLMTALAVANPSGLDNQAWSALRPLGLNHLISISGLHIAMVGMLVAYFAKGVLIILPFTPRRPRVWIMMTGLLAATIYTGLAGFQIPALRSLFMLAVFTFTWTIRGRVSSWRTFFCAMALVLLYQPSSVLAVGFWLSFGLVGTLIWANTGRIRIQTSLIKQAIYAQYAATLMSSIATIAFFGTLPIFAPIANAIAIPLFSWVLTPLALLASVLPFLRPLAACLGEYTMQVLLYLGEKLPAPAFAHAPMPLFLIAIISILILLLPRGTRFKPLGLCGLMAFLCYTPPTPKQLNAIVWDSGQGLSILLRTPTQTVLFDTGTAIATAQAIVPNLDALGIKHLNHLILSHHDDDHDGGFTQIAQHFSIDKIWAGQSQYYPHAQPCRNGTHWQQDGVFFEFLTPTPDAEKDNDKSCVLRVLANQQAMIITGDLGNKSEAQLITQYGDNLRSNVFILGHHGSKHSNSSALINAIAPEFAIASSGFANTYKHPHNEVITRLSAHNVTLLRTDTQGAITINFNTHPLSLAPLIEQALWWQRKPLQNKNN